MWKLYLNDNNMTIQFQNIRRKKLPKFLTTIFGHLHDHLNYEQRSANNLQQNQLAHIQKPEIAVKSHPTLHSHMSVSAAPLEV